jgi:type I restriction enzyme S subunit
MFERIKDVGHPDEEMLSVYRNYGIVKKDSRDDNVNKTAENRNIYQLVDDGWLVINRMKAWQGSVGISPYRGIVSGHYICFRPRHNEDSRFLNWLLRSFPYAFEYARLSRGVRPNQIEIDNDGLHVLPIPLPALEEQRRIADFLDAEITKLDSLISKKLKFLSLLEEKIDSRMLEHIGGSQLVDPDHGTPVLPIRRLLSKVIRPPLANEDVITAYRDGQVTTRALRRAEGYTLSASTDAQGQHVEVNDVVVHGLDGFAGAIGTSEAAGNCSPVYHVCTPLNGGDPVFFGRLLRVLAVSGYLALFAISTRERAVDFRNWDLFGRIPIPDVPLRDQREVGEWISAARPIRGAVERSNTLAEERRQALITAAVTGEFDVSTASGGGVTE